MHSYTTLSQALIQLEKCGEFLWLHEVSCIHLLGRSTSLRVAVLIA